jgi:hypothetical protein
MYDERYAPRPAAAMAEHHRTPGAISLTPSLNDDARASRNAIWLLLGVVVYCGAQVYFLI